MAVQYIQDLTIISLLEEKISHVYRLGLLSFAVRSKIHRGLSCSFLSFFTSAWLLPGKQGKSCIPACQYAPLSVKFLLLKVFRPLHMKMCTVTVSVVTPAFSIPYKKTCLRQIHYVANLSASEFICFLIVSVSFNKVHDCLFVKDRFGSRLWVGLSCLYFGI